jgi:hypothetical protein
MASFVIAIAVPPPAGKLAAVEAVRPQNAAR